MAEIGLITCLTADANTGVGTCPWEPALIVLPIAVPKGAFFTNSDITDIATYLKGRLFHDSPATRWYGTVLLVGLEDGTTEAGTEQYPYGPSERAGTAFVTWTGKFRTGKFCAYQNARKFNGKAEQYDWMFMDKKGRLIGRKHTTTDGELRVYGWDVTDVYVPMWTAPNNSTNVNYNLEWRFADVEQQTTDLIAVETGLSPYTMGGVISVGLTKVSEAADGVYNIKLETLCGKENIGVTYNAELDVTSAFLVTDENGGAITYTITWNATGKYFTFNLDEADPQYPTVGGTIYIQPAAISVWEGLGVGDFDSGIAYEGLRLTVLAT